MRWMNKEYTKNESINHRSTNQTLQNKKTENAFHCLKKNMFWGIIKNVQMKQAGDKKKFAKNYNTTLRAYNKTWFSNWWFHCKSTWTLIQLVLFSLEWWVLDSDNFQTDCRLPPTLASRALAIRGKVVCSMLTHSWHKICPSCARASGAKWRVPIVTKIRS